MKKGKVRGRNIKCTFEDKKGTRKFNVEVFICAKGDEGRNGIKEVVPSG